MYNSVKVGTRFQVSSTKAPCSFQLPLVKSWRLFINTCAMSTKKLTLLDFKPNFTLEDGVRFKMKNYLTPFMFCLLVLV